MLVDKQARATRTEREEEGERAKEREEMRHRRDCLSVQRVRMENCEGGKEKKEKGNK